MADTGKDGPIAPRRSLGGPILPPPPPELAEEAQRAEAQQAEAARVREEAAEREARKRQEKQAQKEAQKQDARRAREARAAQREAEKARRSQRTASRPVTPSASAGAAARQAAPAAAGAPALSGQSAAQPGARPAAGPATKAARRTRRAQLRLVQVDAWSVMKTSFLLSIALGIVLVVAVAIIWAVLGAAGVWDSINSIVQQAVGSDTGKQFNIQDYLGTSRVLGFTMIVAVVDVILITAIATLGAFLYNLAAALLGGIEVTLAEDS